jgi:hypothetical protein
VLSVIILGLIAYLLSPKTKGGRPQEPGDDEDESGRAGETSVDDEPTGQEATTA